MEKIRRNESVVVVFPLVALQVMCIPTLAQHGLAGESWSPPGRAAAPWGWNPSPGALLLCWEQLHVEGLLEQG